MGKLNVDTQLLRSFITIVDAGGFVRAADILHMTQSAISQQMRRLEDLLGKELFQRSGRNMVLSPDGEVLLGYARSIIELNDQVTARLASESPRTMVKLGMPEHFTETVLPRIIAEAKRECPEVQLVIKIATSQVLRDAVDQGEIDLALVLSEVQPANRSTLRTIPVDWMTSNTYEIRQGAEIPLVVFAGQCMFRRMVIGALDSAKISWRIAYESADLTSLRAAVKAELGITGLPNLQPHPDLRVVKAHAILPALSASAVSLQCQSVWLSPAAGRVGQLLRTLLTGANDWSPVKRVGVA